MTANRTALLFALAIAWVYALAPMPAQGQDREFRWEASIECRDRQESSDDEIFVILTTTGHSGFWGSVQPDGESWTFNEDELRWQRELLLCPDTVLRPGETQIFGAVLYEADEDEAKVAAAVATAIANTHKASADLLMEVSKVTPGEKGAALKLAGAAVRLQGVFIGELAKLIELDEDDYLGGFRWQVTNRDGRLETQWNNTANTVIHRNATDDNRGHLTVGMPDDYAYTFSIDNTRLPPVVFEPQWYADGAFASTGQDAQVQGVGRRVRQGVFIEGIPPNSEIRVRVTKHAPSPHGKWPATFNITVFGHDRLWSTHELFHSNSLSDGENEATIVGESASVNVPNSHAMLSGFVKNCYASVDFEWHELAVVGDDVVHFIKSKTSPNTWYSDVRLHGHGEEHQDFTLRVEIIAPE